MLSMGDLRKSHYRSHHSVGDLRKSQFGRSEEIPVVGFPQISHNVM
jgi:hypothetical protein